MQLRRASNCRRCFRMLEIRRKKEGREAVAPLPSPRQGAVSSPLRGCGPHQTPLTGPPFPPGRGMGRGIKKSPKIERRKEESRSNSIHSQIQQIQFHSSSKENNKTNIKNRTVRLRGDYMDCGYHMDFQPQSKTITIRDGRLYEDIGTINETETIALCCGNDAPWIGSGDIVFVPDEGEMERCGIVPVETASDAHEEFKRRATAHAESITEGWGIGW